MITVFGAGFVGLTTALGFASAGKKVFITDVEDKRINNLLAGKIDFVEEGLEEALLNTLGVDFFPKKYSEIEDALKQSEFVFACVGTPQNEVGEVDLSQIYKVLEKVNVINENINKDILAVIKSSVPPGSIKNDLKPYLENLGKKGYGTIRIASNPEFLREGHCWEDFIKADRIIIGTEDEKSKKQLMDLYDFQQCPKVCVNISTAEFIKYESNALLATMISFSNEMSLIAKNIGDIDIKAGFKALHKDKRWGDAEMKSYVYPGCGYGGYCLPKDVKALYHQAKRFGYDAGLIERVDAINESIMKNLYEDIKSKLTKETRIAILGLSFKPNSDDVRMSPAKKMIEFLQEDGFSNIYAHDPVAIGKFSESYGLNVHYEFSYEEILKETDCVIILTAWQEYKKIKAIYKGIIYDLRYYID